MIVYVEKAHGYIYSMSTTKYENSQPLEITEVDLENMGKYIPNMIVRDDLTLDINNLKLYNEMNSIYIEIELLKEDLKDFNLEIYKQMLLMNLPHNEKADQIISLQERAQEIQNKINYHVVYGV